MKNIKSNNSKWQLLAISMLFGAHAFVASAEPWPPFHQLNDHNADLISDIFWRNAATGEDRVWSMNNAATKQADVNAGVLIGGAYNVVGFGDFDGDSDVDALLRNATGNNYIVTLDGGTTVNRTKIGTNAPGFSFLDFIDSDQDGDEDIVWFNQSTGQGVLWVIENSILVQGVNLGYINTRFSPLGMGDIDQDGFADIVFVDNNVGGFAEFAAWKIENNAKATSPWLGFLNSRFAAIDIGDADFDGDVDIFVHDATQNEFLYIELQDATRVGGTWAGVSLGFIATPFTPVGLGDYLGDGDADIYVHNAVNGEHRVIQLEGGIRLGGAFAATGIGTINTRWAPLNLADYDGDGDNDILSRDQSTGEAIIYRSNNGTASSISALGTMNTAFTPYFEQ